MQNKVGHERTKEYDTLVCYSLNLPCQIADQIKIKEVYLYERSTVVFHCQQRILALYKVDKYNKEEKAKRVVWLLDQDQFVCYEDQYEVSKISRLYSTCANYYSQNLGLMTLGCQFRAEEIVDITYQVYFKHPKMRGNRDPGSLT